MVAVMENQEIRTIEQSSSSTNLLLNEKVMDQLYRFAEIMAAGKSTVPAHLSGSVGDCMAVAMQAAQWKMNPYAVAQKTHLVNGVLGYEAQLVNAVINSHAPIEHRLQYEWFGPWELILGKFKSMKNDKGKIYHSPAWEPKDEQGLGVRVWTTMKGEAEPRVLELMLVQAQVRNSTLWASDPKQQLAYLAIKRWGRLHCPDVILGVYTPDELADAAPVERELNPAQQPSPSGGRSKSLLQRMQGNEKAPAAAAETEAEPVGVEAVLEAIAAIDSPQAAARAKAMAQQLDTPEDLDTARVAYQAKIAELEQG